MNPLAPVTKTQAITDDTEWGAGPDEAGGPGASGPYCPTLLMSFCRCLRAPLISSVASEIWVVS